MSAATGEGAGPATRPPAREGTDRAAALVFAVALVVAVAARVSNALRYRTRMGFDAIENVEYVHHLLDSWALPAPDAAWATAHPPFFYYASAAVGRMLGVLDATPALVWVIPLLSSAAGLIGVAALARLVATAPGTDRRRTMIATLLVLYAPVHVYMSAMFSEEILAASLASLAIVGAALFSPGELRRGRAVQRAAAIGLLAGLAWLTKLSGVLVLLAIVAGWGVTAWRRGELHRAWAPLAVLVAVAAVVGGWFYARNLLVYGYLYPQDLAVHAVMFEMPPGERSVLDYVRLPLATFTDPQLLNPDLLHSVWGSTYATLWFDGHRHFLPSSAGAARAGTALLVLALLPTAAFFDGALRGALRWWREPTPRDGVLLALLGATLGGYVAFTWSNPWFATLKGSYLLGSSVPFAYYASESLERWAGRSPWPARLVYGALALLFTGVALVFTIGVVFTKADATGLPWRAPA